MRASRCAARERYTIVGRGGYEVVTITDASGRLLRRFRRCPDGREYVLIDNRPRPGVVIGAAPCVGGIVLLGLARTGDHDPARALHRRRRHRPADAICTRRSRRRRWSPLERAYTLDEIR